MALDIGSTRARRSGFSLLELVVAMGILGIMGLAMFHMFASQVRMQGDIEAQAETHQGLTAAFDALSRDVRLAGACLPIQPFFVPIAGTNNGTTDTITLRTGVLSEATTCVQATLTLAVVIGSTTLTVNDVSGLKAQGWGYVVGSVAGEFFKIAAVSGSSGAGTVTTATALAQAYPISSGVYALEERTYAIDPTSYGIPTLTLAIDRKAPLAVAAGIESLDVSYRLTLNCPICTVVDLPTDNPSWMQVSEVVMSFTARSRQKLSTQGWFRESATMSIQPRNLIAFQSS